MKNLFLVSICFFVVVGIAHDVCADGYSAVLQWSAPTQRENGEPLTVDELGGYEIRVYLQDDPDYKTIVIPDGQATGFRVNDLPSGTHSFRIAAYDISGLYSNFVSITHSQSGPPGAPSGVRVGAVGHDVISACLADPNCRVAIAGEW
jgi:hypothetical protein